MTLTTVISSIGTTLIFITCLAVLMKLKVKISNASLLLILAAILLQSVIVIEFPFTRTIASEKYYWLISMLRSSEKLIITSIIIWIGVALVLEVLFLWETMTAHRFIKQFKAKAVMHVTREKNIVYYLLEDSEIYEPCTFGIATRVVLLPKDLPEGQRGHILLHEEAHIENKDCLIALLIEQLCIVFWWNLALVPLKKLILDTQEMRADELAIYNLTGEERIAYAETMIDIAKRLQKNKVGLGFLYNRFTMKQRISQVLDQSTKRTDNGILQYAIAVAIVISSCLFIVEPSAPEAIFLSDEDSFPNAGEIEYFSIENEFYAVEIEDGVYHLFNGETLIKEVQREEIDKSNTRIIEKE